MLYDCIIIGGGIAGLQAAIQLGRYDRHVLVIDKGEGRSSLCRQYRNLLGWPEGVSGQHLRKMGRVHVQDLRVRLLEDKVQDVEKQEQQFTVHTDQYGVMNSKCLLFATGITDRLPPFSELKPCLGLTVYICPDCDGYEVKNRPTLVLGAGKAGAMMAQHLTYWTNEMTYVNHDQKPVSESVKKALDEKGITYVEQPIKKVLTEKEWRFRGVQLQSGESIYADRAFVAFDGNTVQSQLAKELGVERLENQHIQVDARTKMTNVDRVWAAGDVVAHSEQVAIAMGEGVQAGIWIHKKLLQEE